MTDTSVTINGTTYHTDGDYDIIDGMVYVCDPNHQGYFSLNEEALNKYFNGNKDMVEDMGADDFYEPWDEDGENGDYDAEFPYHFVFYHAVGVINPDTGETEEVTPHGEVYEEDFVAWFNQFSVEVFEDDTNVIHHAFCDG